MRKTHRKIFASLILLITTRYWHKLVVLPIMFDEEGRGHGLLSVYIRFVVQQELSRHINGQLNLKFNLIRPIVYAT